MTPEQLKQKPFEEIFKNQLENVDTDEGESIEEEEKSTTSSDMSNKILNLTVMLMILKIKKIHIHQKHCKFIIYTIQQCMIKMI